VDGHDAAAVAGAIEAARADTGRPSLICCRTVIGYGSPNKAGKAAAHGAPLGASEVAAAREQLGWTHAAFTVPAGHYAAWDARGRGAALEGDSVTIQALGLITEPSWQWIPGPLWLGSNGVITQTIPVTGMQWRLGTALTATTVLWEPDMPIIQTEIGN
jgi:hypothetical protein